MHPQAAILAEHLARTNPKMAKAPLAGSYAVDFYNQSQIDLRKLKEKAADSATNEKIWDDRFNADLNRLREAAAFVIKQWPTDVATDQARHIIGFLALRDKKFDEAWQQLAEIHNGYSDLQRARSELAGCMFAMVYPTDAKDVAGFKKVVKDRIKQHDKEWKKTIAALESVPTPSDNASAYEVANYIDNRMQLASLYQLEDAQVKAQKIGEVLVKSMGNFANLAAPQRTSQSM
jgi:hypothetical protein